MQNREGQKQLIIASVQPGEPEHANKWYWTAFDLDPPPPWETDSIARGFNSQFNKPPLAVDKVHLPKSSEEFTLPQQQQYMQFTKDHAPPSHAVIVKRQLMEASMPPAKPKQQEAHLPRHYIQQLTTQKAM